MKVTYLGTTMLLFADGQDQVLFDCHITRPSLLRCFAGLLRTDEAVADRVLADFRINRLAAIFISHTHHDHVMDAPYIARKTGAHIYGSRSAMNVAIGGGIPKDKLHCYDDFMVYQVGSYRITIIPSIHSVAHWYNNDLGQTIDIPLVQPAKKKAYKEGGSFDFLVEHSGKKYLIRPSYNFIPHQLDHIRADVLFLGVAGLAQDTIERKQQFYAETINKVQPKTVIPVHWDNFFTPLYDRSKWMTGALDDPKHSLDEAKAYCEQSGVQFILQLPLSTLDIDSLVRPKDE